MATKQVHILSSVNAGAVNKAGTTYTISNVCGATDGLVMNGLLYPGDQLAKGAPSLEGKPAPAGHPRDDKGRAISATSGDALLSSYAGAICRNARHESGRTLVDIVVNEPQARAHPDGLRLVERLDAAISGTNAEPIHVSTGLMLDVVVATGESRGKKYSAVATNLRYDHLAFLLDTRGAGTPDDGVAMFMNADGSEQTIERMTLPPAGDDRRSAGLMRWLNRLIGNGSAGVSFDAIREGLYSLMPDGAWIQEVFDRFAIWRDANDKHWKQDYSVSSDGSVAFAGIAEEVRREVTYEPINNSLKGDNVKDKLLAALNAAGISGAEAMSDAQLLTAYNALIEKPHRDALVAANSQIAGFEAKARAAEDAEVGALATEMAANSSLTADDLKKLGATRLRELKAIAAPVLTGRQTTNKQADEFAGYSLNEPEGAAK